MPRVQAEWPSEEAQDRCDGRMPTNLFCDLQIFRRARIRFERLVGQRMARNRFPLIRSTPTAGNCAGFRLQRCGVCT